MHPAIFLDRDGVVIENRDSYIRSWADVQFIPEALKALADAHNCEYKFVIVTNQSAVGRGIISYEIASAINQQVVEQIEKCGGRIEGVYMCPHAPDEGCACRKPEPGLLLQAAQELGLDLKRSIIIGDAISDLMAGRSAGTAVQILVKTGRGLSQSRLPDVDKLAPFLFYENLALALRDVLSSTPTHPH
jgi:D-glycero-D-manno-heptose 1,7-bisphosphate phosphatase